MTCTFSLLLAMYKVHHLFPLWSHFSKTKKEMPFEKKKIQTTVLKISPWWHHKKYSYLIHTCIDWKYQYWLHLCCIGQQYHALHLLLDSCLYRIKSLRVSSSLSVCFPRRAASKIASFSMSCSRVVCLFVSVYAMVSPSHTLLIKCW